MCNCGKINISHRIRKQCHFCRKEIRLQWLSKEINTTYKCLNCQRKFKSKTLSPIKTCFECGSDAACLDYNGDFFNSLRKVCTKLNEISFAPEDLLKLSDIQNELVYYISSYPKDFHNPERMYGFHIKI